MELTKKLELLKELCELDCVSGCEDRAAEWILAHLPADCKAHRDGRGNIICEKKGKNPAAKKVMFTTYMDEVGFLINYIEESGLLRFVPQGDIDTRVVVGKAVRLESGKKGVVGAKPIHLQTAAEREQVLPYSQLYIDIGAKTREEAEKFAQLGDFAVWRTEYTQLGNKISAKALDNKVGCIALLDLLTQELPYDICAVFAVQEQIGAQAAANAAFALKADIAVCIDAVSAGDLPGVSAVNRIGALGKGPVLTFQNKRCFTDSQLFAQTKEICVEKEIAYQLSSQNKESTSAEAIQRVDCGCRVLPVGIPIRYRKTPNCVFDPQDLEITGKLLRELAEAFAQ